MSCAKQALRLLRYSLNNSTGEIITDVRPKTCYDFEDVTVVGVVFIWWELFLYAGDQFVVTVYKSKGVQGTVKY